MTNAELIRQSRAILEASQKQLAAMLNVSTSAVVSWENGKREPRLETFRAILEAIASRTLSTAERHDFIKETAQRISGQRKLPPGART